MPKVKSKMRPYRKRSYPDMNYIVRSHCFNTETESESESTSSDSEVEVLKSIEEYRTAASTTTNKHYAPSADDLAAAGPSPDPSDDQRRKKVVVRYNSESGDFLGRKEPESDEEVVYSNVLEFFDLDQKEEGENTFPEGKRELEETQCAIGLEDLHLSDSESVDLDVHDDVTVSLGESQEAQVCTAEDAVLHQIDRLTKLKNLYVEESKRLIQSYARKKKTYNEELREEKKQRLPSLREQSKTSAEEMDRYRQFKAMEDYHKLTGVEAILNEKKKQKLAKESDGKAGRRRRRRRRRCIYEENRVRCNNDSLPLTKHCMQHILHDEKQQLFKACKGNTATNTPCNEPVLDVDSKYCIYHLTFSLLDDQEDPNGK